MSIGEKGKEMNEEIMSYGPTATITGLKLNHLYTLVHRKRIPHIRLSRRMVLFRRSEIEKWLQDHAVPIAEVVR